MKAQFRVPNPLVFRGDVRNWKKFKQQFDIYLKVTGLSDTDSENKVNVFLNIAGEEALEIYNNLKLTQDEQKDFDAVMREFTTFCSSQQQNVMYKSFKFFTRTQQPGECFNDFYNDLQVMADFCNFGDQRERLIRDRIIAGIRDNNLQEKFLSEPDLILDEVVERCQLKETELINLGQLKYETENVEKQESNNNHEELLDNVYNFSESEECDQPIIEQSVNNFCEEEDVPVDEEIMIEEVDVKPIVQTTTKLKNLNGKKSEKKKNAETIQMKIAEIKKKLSNAIRNERKNEEMGTRKKVTRSRTRNVEIKFEAPETNGVEMEQEENNTLIEDEKIDELDGEGNEENTKTDKTVLDPTGIYDFSEEGNSIEIVEEMALAEYVIEQEEQETIVKNVKKIQKRTGQKKDDIKIIKVQRDNLPPLLLKTVKKKTLLLGKMPYPCKKCDASFWTTVQLERHQLVHVLKKVTPTNTSVPKKVFKCEDCGKEFKKICDLERHTRVHTGEKPSVCNICNKRFQQAYNLNKHLLIHTQEKNFECVICQKKFGRNDVLNRHVLTHSIDKPFHCSICSKTFIRNTQLNLHLKKHHGLTEETETGKGGSRNNESVDDPVAGKSSD